MVHAMGSFTWTFGRIDENESDRYVMNPLPKVHLTCQTNFSESLLAWILARIHNNILGKSRAHKLGHSLFSSCICLVLLSVSIGVYCTHKHNMNKWIHSSFLLSIRLALWCSKYVEPLIIQRQDIILLNGTNDKATRFLTILAAFIDRPYNNGINLQV